VSAPPFDSLNLADHVGDQPEAVARNRAIVAAWFGTDRLATMGPVHGAEVAAVDRPGTTPAVDGLITRTPGLVLLALGADCVPVGLVGDEWIGVVHCGWRGLVADAVGAAVRAIEAGGDRVRTAILGPAVCGACYPVPPERADEVRRRLPADAAAAGLVTARTGEPGIDVRAGLGALLTRLGVVDVIVVEACTVEDPGLFSYRRDGVTGRQGLALRRGGPGEAR
jgi:YfiH family protein